jgi:hypothetical protein
VYATREDLRAEGVSADQVSDDRVDRALEEATALIDAVTGQFFEPRSHTFVLAGRGAPSVWLPVPILRLDSLAVGGTPWPIGGRDLIVVGAPVMPGTDGPRLTRTHGGFPRDVPIIAEGLWGYTEADGTSLGRTPLAIRRACLLLAMRFLPQLATDESVEARAQGRVIEERTRDQSYRLQGPSERVPVLTADAEVDALLWPFLRRPGLGAA